jgi:mono/diheme cytochrome c family protein
MRLVYWIGGVVAVALLGAIGLFVLWPWAESANSGAVARGRDLYAANCAVCHGANLQGQPNWRDAGEDGVYPAPPHDVNGHTWHHGDRVLFDYTKLGGAAALEASGVTGFASGMPAFGEQLSDTQIMDILAFIKSTWTDRERAVQQDRTTSEQLDGS